MIGYSINQITTCRLLKEITIAWKEPDMTVIEQLRKEPVFSEGKKYAIRNLTEKDRDNYFRTLLSVSFIPRIYEEVIFQDISWQDAITSGSSLIFAVERKSDHTYVGDCMLKQYENDNFEVGFDISPEYQNQGIGTEVMHMLIKETRRRFPDKRIVARVYSDNEISQHILKKLGGRKVGEELSEYEAALAIIGQLKEEYLKPALKDAEMLIRNHIDIYAFD